MSGIISLVTVSVLLLGWVDSHKLGVGPCQDIPGMENFDQQKFYGKWYINEIYSSINTCMTLDFAEKAGSPNEIKVSQGRQLVGLDAVDITHTTNYVGTAVIGETTPSKMTIKWPTSGLFGKMSYTIIDTDYTNYALTFECQRLLFVGRWYSASILSKSPTLEPTVLEEVRQKAKAAGLDIDSLKSVSQVNCAKPGDGFDFNTDPEAFNLLGLISDDKLETIKTEEEFLNELGNTPKNIVIL